MGSRSVSAFYYLSGLGIPLRFPDCGRALHAKLVIIDERVLFVGSHNMYDYSLSSPLELTSEIDSFSLGEQSAAAFRAWWDSLVIIPFLDGVSWLKS